MTTQAGYVAPLRDIGYVLYDLLGAEDLVARDTAEAVLSAGGRFAERELGPLNAIGDASGCRFEDGRVTTPPGFKQAYAAFASGGWSGLSADEAMGGQGLPETINLALAEMISAANLSFSNYPGLSHGAYNAIKAHGSDQLKERYLPKLASGEWTGTMCLTEPQCGTDLGLVRTRAEAAGAGTFKITGSKIFISAGEHDLAANILHLVLARAPEGGAGTKGLSLYLVPKFLPDVLGEPTIPNAVACSRIEHKMGLAASATCALDFDGATGFLVGTSGLGMSHMFTMMNLARLAVGVQGLGIAEAAYQRARKHAQERLQGRAVGGAVNGQGPADPIIAHPDVRRMLLTMRAGLMGGRALAYWTAIHLDRAARAKDPGTRQAADDLVQLLTPVVKGYLTDHGVLSANLAIQVMGGHGYIREMGVEQLARDARITQLYEGTNGIQALDLVGRKLGLAYGRLLRRFFHPVAEFLEREAKNETMTPFVAPLGKAFGRLKQASLMIARKGLADPTEGAAAANDYARLFALVAVGYLWAHMARLSLGRLNGEDAAFHRAQLATARFFMTKLLPETGALFASLSSGAAPLMGLDAGEF